MLRLSLRLPYQFLKGNLRAGFASLSPPPFANLDPKGLSQENVHTIQNYGKRVYKEILLKDSKK